MNIADEIDKLNTLKEKGALTDEEYQTAKGRLLNQQAPLSEKLGGINMDEKSWAIFIHISQFCGYLLPLLGLVVPIVLWQMKKQESPVLDQHGCIVANWIVSLIIYGAISAVLCLVGIGFLLFAVLAVVSIIFPIVGAIRASENQVWVYPLSLNFFKPTQKPLA